MLIHPILRRPAMAGLGALLLAAPAAAGHLSGPHDPTQADAPVPSLVYQSPLRSSPSAAPADDQAWRAANDLTGRIGGWRAYLREAHGGGAEATPPTAASAPPGAASAPPVRRHRH